jgi:hypothetical protein
METLEHNLPLSDESGEHCSKSRTYRQIKLHYLWTLSNPLGFFTIQLTQTVTTTKSGTYVTLSQSLEKDEPRGSSIITT